MSDYKYLFGPVPSRRLGRSLGVDLIPFKTCTMDCTYCQLGETPCAVSERGDYVPIQDVLAELERWRTTDGQADHITLAGSGEPTLHTRFGEVLRWVKDNTDIPSVLLTNGSLLHLPEVRTAAALADKVKVTLSAWDEASFRQIHRPAQDVTFDLLVEGERVFRREYTGELSVEVFIVDGVNSDVSNVRKIAAIAETLNPDRIDLNTAVRPPADSGVHAATPEQLAELAKLFGPKATVAASFKTKVSGGRGSDGALPSNQNKSQAIAECGITPEALLSLIKRHPATCAQLAREFNQPAGEMAKMLGRMVASGLLNEDRRDGESYFFLRRA